MLVSYYLWFDAKVWNIENKSPDHNKYITTPEFNTLAAISFDKRLKPTNLATKSAPDTVL